ncbi:MAG: YihY/virulence factor BrkB family protein, partial [Gemmatimonadales bacterium]
MAGAITFNVVIAVIPLVLLTAGLAGFVVSGRFEEIGPRIVDTVLGYLPATGELGVRDLVDRFLEGLVQDRASLSIAGGLVLAWLSTRLVATLRIVLRDVFELERERGAFMGKLFDFQVVLLGGLLILLNLAITVVVQALEALGALFLGPEGTAAALLQQGAAMALALASAWVLFFLLYRFVPAKGIPFRTAVLAASIAAAGFELLKQGFAWYVTSVADYSSMYGSLGVAVVLFLWIYYSAVLFIMAGLVARTYEVGRKKQMRDSTHSARSVSASTTTA